MYFENIILPIILPKLLQHKAVRIALRVMLGLGAVLTFVGLILKFTNVTSIPLVVGFALAAISFFLMAYEKNTFDHLLLFWSMGVVLIGVLFLLMHWPGGRMLTIVGALCVLIALVVGKFLAKYPTDSGTNKQ